MTGVYSVGMTAALVKLGFNLRDAKRIMEITEPLVVLRRGATPHALPRQLTELPYKYDIQQIQQSTRMRPANKAKAIKALQDELADIMSKDVGKIVMPAEGDIANWIGKRYRRYAVEQASPSAARYLPTDVRPFALMSPKERLMTEAMTRGHELRELQDARHVSLRRPISPFMERYEHISPLNIIRGRNEVVTLPRGYENVREAAKQVYSTRPKSEGELLERATASPALNRPGLSFTTGPRLSRHAAKHVAKRMQELAFQDLPKAKQQELLSWLPKKTK